MRTAVLMLAVGVVLAILAFVWPAAARDLAAEEITVAVADGQRQAASRAERSSRPFESGAHQVLPVGGRTIGGPAIAKWPSQGTFQPYTVLSGSTQFQRPPSVCITVANLRKSAVFFGAVGSGQVASVEDGEARTLCSARVDGFSLFCEGDNTCRVVWRLDEPVSGLPG